jgi:hypothetical protein
MKSHPRTLDKSSGLEMDNEPQLLSNSQEITATLFHEQPKSCSINVPLIQKQDH